MTTQQLAYTEIEKLVNNFKSIPASQRRGLNEMQARHGHILPLFKVGLLNKSKCIFLNFQSAYVNCHDICYTFFRLESSKIRLNLAFSDDLDM